VSINSRLAALESIEPSRGLRHFATANQVEFFEASPGGYSYDDTIMCSDGKNPTDRRAWSKDELASLCDQGYTVIVVHWTDKWRGDDESQ
jgi:hypothetical protein